MKSKVREYQELYEGFQEIREKVSKIEEPIADIEKEISKLQEKQSKVDYNNHDIIISFMETYIDESIEKQKNKIRNEVSKKMVELTSPTKKVKRNFENVVKCLSRIKVSKILHTTDIDLEEEIWVEKAEKATKFNVSRIINIIFSYVFRFDFLKVWPKWIRILIGVIFWIIILIISTIRRVYKKFVHILDNELAGLSNAEFEIAIEEFAKDVVGVSITSFLLVVILIIVINIVAYCLMKYYAKKYLEENSMLCLSLIGPGGLEEKIYEHNFKAYMEDTVAVWKKEIELIKNSGLSDTPNEDSLAYFIKKDLYEKYQAFEDKINACKTEIESIQGKSKQLNSDLQDTISKLKDMESEVDSMIIDSNHNDAVLTPYVSIGYSQCSIEGVKELVYLKHNYKPMMICYEDDTEKDEYRFRKNAAKLIELFMNGFMAENYPDYINMCLVNFASLLFPECRRHGMKVIDEKKDIENVFTELKATRKNINALEDGRIKNINPTRLANRENPIKYNIVFFIGYDFETIEQEITQLFVGGENFGFLPIVFMKKSCVRKMLENDGATNFSQVVEKMRRDNQIYGFESLVSEFEYHLMVSDQKRLLDENFCVNKIMSMNEFVDIAGSEEGMDIDNILYLDTYKLDKEVYDSVRDLDFIRFFTINGKIPEFITKEVIKL